MKPGVLEGRVAWIFDDHFDVDLIVGVEKMGLSDPEEILFYCMKDLDPNFTQDVRPGDVLVGGRNFGYGHPHYPSMIAMRELGIECVVAESFSPYFRRGENCNGMILVSCPGISQAVERWDRLRVSWREGRVEVPERSFVGSGPPPSVYTQRMVDAGGLSGMLKGILASEESGRCAR